MSDVNVKKKMSGATKLGWVSFGLTAAGLVGCILCVIALAIPSSKAGHKIADREVFKALLFFLGAIPAFMVSPAGCITGIIALVKMIKRNEIATVWLPVIGIGGFILAYAMIPIAIDIFA